MSEPCKVTIKDAYEELWRCRDFELKHLWQRSVFLAVFLTGTFAGYGGFFNVWIGKRVGCDALSLLNLNLIGFGISLVGVICSLLWIMLAKGSKAWYERYEGAISNFIEIADVDEQRKQSLFEDGADRIIAFAYADDFKRFSGPVSSWIWNTKGGAYSPSKINVAIGHLSLLVWIVISCCHIAIASVGVDSAKTMLSAMQRHNLSAPSMAFVLLFGLLVFWLYSRLSLKSGILEEKQ